MAIHTIDAKLLQKMFLAGAKRLESKKELINDLNVFPVPDGDTGTNMTLTIMSAAKEVSALRTPDMESLAKAISSGSLRGARGNSGVILSQLFRGFTKEIANVKKIDADVLAAGMERAVETAYKAVMKPKEGTILTVAKGASAKASEMAMETDDLEEIIREVIEHAEYVLSQTPEMLPVLKEAGVVDSGGQGLLEVLKGAYDALLGKEVEFDAVVTKEVLRQGSKQAMINPADIEFGYCTEFIIMLEKEFSFDTELKFKRYLESIGDSIVCVADDDIVKVHVHTNDPGLVIQKALTYGSLTKMKIDNMREEHNELLIRQEEIEEAQNEDDLKEPEELQEPKEPEDSEEPDDSEEPEVSEESEDNESDQSEAYGEFPVIPEVPEVIPDIIKKEYGFITVVAGEGLGKIFKGLGVDYLIEGGQTMNPSTEDILNAAENVPADTIFILPNNRNIILAAEQATHIIEDKKLIVIPSKTVPQGISAMINFELGKSLEENISSMKDGMTHVKTGQLTYAVRDTVIDGMEIKCDDIMALGDTGIITVGKSVNATLIDMIQSMVNWESELISLYYGSDITQEQAENVCSEIKDLYPDIDIEVMSGGQPIYYYIVSVE